MWYADSLGLRSVVDEIRELSPSGGGAYWTVAPLLAELAHAGRTFADWDRERPV
jgi:3-hydroxyacyl-CoA dehydrogenase